MPRGKVFFLQRSDHADSSLSFFDHLVKTHGYLVPHCRALAESQDSENAIYNGGKGAFLDPWLRQSPAELTLHMLRRAADNLNTPSRSARTCLVYPHQSRSPLVHAKLPAPRCMAMGEGRHITKLRHHRLTSGLGILPAPGRRS